MSDTGLMIGIILSFLILGFASPFIHNAFVVSSAEVNTSGFQFLAGQVDISALTIMFSIFSIFFWTFGLIPAWLDFTLVMAMRLTLAVLVWRNIRGVGG